MMGQEVVIAVVTKIIIVIIIIFIYCCFKRKATERRRFSSTQQNTGMPIYAPARRSPSSFPNNRQLVDYHADDNTTPHQNDFRALPTSMPLPPSEFRENRSAPYPPVISAERRPTGFGYSQAGFQEEVTSAPPSNGMPHPADYCPYPTSRRTPYPLGSDDMPHPSRSRPSYSQTRSYAAEDLPPSYAEAVEQQPPVARQQQRKSTAETSVHEHV